MDTNPRAETDLQGEVKLRAGALFGANTARGVENLTVLLWPVGSEFPLSCGLRGNGMNFVRPEQLDAIDTGLPRVGDVEQHLHAILGVNLLRIARQVWKVPA